MTRVAFLFILTISLQPAGAQSPSPDSALCRLVASGNLPTLRWPEFSDYKTRVQRFYEPGYIFGWARDGKLTEQATAVIEALATADTKGLNSADYDGPRWAGRVASVSRADQPPSQDELAEFDLALTVSVMRYVSDLHFGRANPGIFHSEFDTGHERFDLPSFLQQRLLHSADVKAALEEMEPPYEGYRQTEQALERYIVLAHEDQGGLLPLTKKPIDPGGQYPAVTQLAGLLRRLGDLPENAHLTPDSTAYAGALVDAVKHFQVRHGLDPDGRLGKGTLAELNTPLTDRIQQLQLTLERWRWVPHNFPRPPIVVNIPEFELRALDASYRTELEMKVVVGKAYHHQTPVFAANLKQVIFRPYWNVPLSIQRAELVPRLDRDSSYLAKNRYEVVNPQGKVVTDGIVEGPTLAQLRAGTLRIRQTPGSENALGLVAFMFPNEYDVYLHGTPAMELFAKSRRDFSHGCIRAEKPQELAAWVMRNQPEWTPEKIADAMDGTKTIYLSLDEPIPVLIVYATAVVLANGEVQFFEDIYQQDAELATLLAKGYPYTAGKSERGPRQRE
jgi:murein L,D-transpeptidase YcbB/YkuD